MPDITTHQGLNILVNWSSDIEKGKYFKMRIVIADDHPLFRDGLRQLLTKQFNGAEIIDAPNFSTATDALNDDTDLLVIDLTFPEFEPLADLVKLRREYPTTPIIVMSMENNAARIQAVMSCGVNGYISKVTNPEQIDYALKSVMEGNVVVHGVEESQQPGAEITAYSNSIHNLSTRQLQVLKGICDGKSNKEIARDLHLSPNTIRLHVSAILKQFDVGSRTGAAKIGISAGLINTEYM